MKKKFNLTKPLFGALAALWMLSVTGADAQVLAFPGAGGFGKYSTGARGVEKPEIYVVSNLNDSGHGSFRDAVSRPGRFVVFAVGGIIRLKSSVHLSPNTTVAGQTAPGDGIVLYGMPVSFSYADNTIARYLRIRYSADAGKSDASGIANGANIILDHMSITWGQDEVFSINFDHKGNEPDNITVQNSIIGQGLHYVNHSAGGLIQPGNGKVSLLRNLYISNKTRNPKVKGINEFVNNVIYNWGNAGNKKGHKESGAAYIMGGSAQESRVNIIGNYFISGPFTPDQETPFSRGTPTFHVYASGNYYDKNKNGRLDGRRVPVDKQHFPGITNFRSQPFDYPSAIPGHTAEEAFRWVLENAGAIYPKRDEVDAQMISQLKSAGTEAAYIYRESDTGLSNGGLGKVNTAPAPSDRDKDGIPDRWEDKHGLDKTAPSDALMPGASEQGYLNIEIYINSIAATPVR